MTRSVEIGVCKGADLFVSRRRCGACREKDPGRFYLSHYLAIAFTCICTHNYSALSLEGFVGFKTINRYNESVSSISEQFSGISGQ